MTLSSTTFPTWNTIRRKHIRLYLMELYVLSLQQKYHLSPLCCKVILVCIHLAMIFKFITPLDIKYFHGKIQHIPPIEVMCDTWKNNILSHGTFHEMLLLCLSILSYYSCTKHDEKDDAEDDVGVEEEDYFTE